MTKYTKVAPTRDSFDTPHNTIAGVIKVTRVIEEYRPFGLSRAGHYTVGARIDQMIEEALAAGVGMIQAINIEFNEDGWKDMLENHHKHGTNSWVDDGTEVG